MTANSKVLRAIPPQLIRGTGSGCGNDSGPWIPTDAMLAAFSPIDLQPPTKRRKTQPQLTEAAPKSQREELRKPCDVSKIEATPGQMGVGMLQVQVVESRS